MKSEHTPGPWGFCDGEVYSLDSRNGGTVATIHPRTGKVQRLQAIADGKLVAAAPLLLSALRAAIVHLPDKKRVLALKALSEAGESH